MRDDGGNEEGECLLFGTDPAARPRSHVKIQLLNLEVWEEV
jgi:hypothetical protein